MGMFDWMFVIVVSLLAVFFLGMGCGVIDYK